MYASTLDTFGSWEFNRRSSTAYLGDAEYVRGCNDGRDNNDNGGPPTDRYGREAGVQAPVHPPKLSEEALGLAIAQSKLEELAK
jgi:hypothetical protein